MVYSSVQMEEMFDIFVDAAVIWTFRLTFIVISVDVVINLTSTTSVPP